MLKKVILISLFVIITGVLYAGMDEQNLINPIYQNDSLSLNSLNTLPDLCYTGSMENENANNLVAVIVTKPPLKKQAAPAKKQPGVQSGWHPSILNICGYALIVAGVGGLGAGYYFDTLVTKDLSAAQKKYDDYKNATSDTDTKWKAYQDSFNQAVRDAQYRNIFYIGGAVTLGAGIILALIPNNPKKTAGIYVTPNSINVALRF